MRRGPAARHADRGDAPPLRGRWLASWTLCGLVLGLVLATTGDSGHLPAWLLPPLTAAAAAVAGVLALVAVLLVRRAVPAAWQGGGRRSLLAAAGGAAAVALLAAPLGVERVAALLAGATFGLLAALAARPRPPAG